MNTSILWKNRNFWWIWLLGVALWPAQGFAQHPPDDNAPVQVGTPRIDLSSVERALWQTTATNAHDFHGWLQRFEDEVNAIYFATLRQQYPQTPPESLLPQPVRVEPRWIGGMLYLYGYLDQNNVQGFQQGQDILLFTLQQTRPFNPMVPALSYSLSDGAGYYYRDDAYSYAWGAAAPFFAGFFLYPQYWRGSYWRHSFAWWGSSYWNTGFFHNRYSYYYRLYPTYYSTYRSNYYVRYRPWGWRSGVFFRSTGGRYVYRNPRWVVQNRPRVQTYRTWIQQRHTIRRTQIQHRYRQPVRVHRQPVRVHRQPVRTHRQPVRTHRTKRHR